MPRSHQGSPNAAAAGAGAAAAGPPPQQPAPQPQPQAPPPQGLPSPPGLTYDSVLVQPAGTMGVTVPKFLLADAREPTRPMVTFVPQRFLEIVLFNRYDGGSSGAVQKILTFQGLSRTAWTINSAAVLNGELSQVHSTFIFDKYKELLPTDGDPVLSGRIRNIVLLPVATAAAVCRIRGYSDTTMTFLRACAPNQIPQSWMIQERGEELAEQGDHDLLLVDQLEEAEDIDQDVVAPSFAAELRAGGFSSFKQTVADEQSHDYAIKPNQLGAKLDGEARTYIAFKVSPLEARRASTAVVETTAQADLQSYYRFLGFLKLKNKLPRDVHLSLDLLTHASAPQWVADFVEFLKEERNLAFSSMANYINSLFGLASYVWDSEEFEVADAVANANHTVLDALVNTRNQCESLAKEAGLYSEKRGGWISWETAQKARVKCLEALQATQGAADPRQKKQLLMDAIVMTIFTYGPVDRVGVIRKLRVGDTLVKDAATGAWQVDLTKALRGHKSAKFHGGTKHALPKPTWPLIDRLAQLTVFDLHTGADKYYLFHPNTARGTDPSRALTEGPFGQWVAGLFEKYSGTRVVPKNLRSIFIVWLKDQEGASEKILNASATAMRHHVNTQASLAYDIDTNNRQIALANEFAAKFAAKFQPSASAAGSSSSAGGAAAADDDDDTMVVRGFWLAKLAPADEQPAAATGKRRFILRVPLSEFTGFEGGFASFDAPGGDGTWYNLPGSFSNGTGLQFPVLQFRMMLDSRGAVGDEVTVTEMTLHKPSDEADAAADATDAVRSSIRSNHLELNLLGGPGTMPTELPPLAAQARERLVRSDVPLPAPDGPTQPELTEAARLAASAPEAAPAAAVTVTTAAMSGVSLTTDETLAPDLAPTAAPTAAPLTAAAAPGAPQRSTKRTGKAVERLELGDGAASRWKSPRGKAPASAPTPMTNEWSDGGFEAGDAVEAMGRGPGGTREWFKATVTKIRAPPAWPPIVVKYTATLEGNKNRLALPEPISAYLHADDVRRAAA